MVFESQEAYKLLNVLERIEQTLRRQDSILGDVIRRTGGDLKNIVPIMDEIGEHGTKGLTDMQEIAADTVELMTSKWTDVGSVMDHAMDTLKQKFDILERTPFFKAMFGNPDQPGGISGAMSGLGRVLDQARTSIVGGTQFGAIGGFFGLLLEGRNQEAGFRAEAAQALHIFEQVGSTAGESIQGLADRIKRFRADLNMSGAEFQNVFKIFADASVTAEEAGKDLPVTFEGYGKSIAEATILFDQFYQVAAGTTAQSVARIMQDTGVGIDKALESTIKMADAARNANVNVGGFINTLLEATSGLRLHRQETTDLTQTYGALATSIEKIFPGANKEFVAKSALGSLQGLTQGMQSMDIGTQAFFARRMAPAGTQDLDALMQFQTRMGNKQDSGFLGSLLTQIIQFTKEISANKGEQFVALQRGPVRFDPQTALAIIEMTEASRKMDMGDVVATYGEKIAKGIGLRMSHEDPMDRLIREFKDVIGSLGNLLLQSLTTIIRLLMTGLAVLAHPEDKKDILDANLKVIRNSMGAAVDKLSASGKALYGTSGDIIKDVVGPLDTFSGEGARAYLKRAKASAVANPTTQAENRRAGADLAGDIQTARSDRVKRTLDAGDGKLEVEIPEFKLKWVPSATTSEPKPNR